MREAPPRGTMIRLLSGPEGRKGIAYTQALLVLLVLAGAAAWDGLTAGGLDSLLMALAGILATFSGGNVGEHYAGRLQRPATAARPPPG